MLLLPGRVLLQQPWGNARKVSPRNLLLWWHASLQRMRARDVRCSDGRHWLHRLPAGQLLRGPCSDAAAVPSRLVLG